MLAFHMELMENSFKVEQWDNNLREKLFGGWSFSVGKWEKFFSIHFLRAFVCVFV